MRRESKKYAVKISEGPPVRDNCRNERAQKNSSPPPVRKLVLGDVEGAVACYRRDKPVEATVAVFRLAISE